MASARRQQASFGALISLQCPQSLRALLAYIQSIEARSSSREQVDLLRLAGAVCQPISCVPEAGVAERRFVVGKVAFEHAARRTERFNARFDVRTRGSRNHLGRWRRDSIDESEIARAHAKATDLDEHVAFTALIAAMPFTNSVSPTERISIGPVTPYIAAACTNTVATMLWPLLVSRSRSSRRYGAPRW